MKNLLPILLFVVISGCVQTVSESNGEPDFAPTINAFGIEMVALRGGEFNMGWNGGDEDEGPQHAVTVSPFMIDKFEVTHEMFTKAELPNPSHWQDDPRKPVERVRWRDAKQYCNERSLMEGLQPCYDEEKDGWPCDFSADGYRLPTEAEWEFACRAGRNRPFDFGIAANLPNYANFADNSDQRTHRVDSRKPNSWGIHGMYGNVSEWCQDVYDADYYKQSPSVDPTGPAGGGKDEKRVMRGGSWKSSASMCRASFRQGQRTGDTDACFYTDYCGFRCVRRITAEQFVAFVNGEAQTQAPMPVSDSSSTE